MLGAALALWTTPAVGQPNSTLVVTNATIIDGTGADARAGMSIVVDGDRIVAVVPDGSASVPDRPDVLIDAGGATVIPGLIDAHVHLGTNPNAPDWRERSERSLAEMLRGGVTGVRDMAGDARKVGELATAVANGEIVGPRIDFSAIVAGPGFFEDPRVQASSRGVPIGEAPWARSIDANSDIEAVVADAAATGATGIKAYALVEPTVLAAVARAASARGLAVWAHSTVFPTRPSEAVDAGVEVLSHAAYLAWEGSPPTEEYTRRGRGDFVRVPPDHPSVTALLEKMADRGTLLDASAALMHRIAPRDDVGELRADWTFEVGRRAHEAGVRIVAGTDFPAAPGDPPSIHEEIEVLVSDVGLSPLEAIQAATLHGAAAIGIEDDYGTIEVGKIANLVILDADPLADIRNTTLVRTVIQNGVVVGAER